MSPFAKNFLNKNVIDACIEGNQYDMLEYLIKGTNKSA